MNFDLSPEQRLLEETVRRFFAKDFPLASVRTVFDGPDGTSDELWKMLAELGLLGTCVDPEHGGIGLGVLDLALVSECLGYAAAPGPFVEHVLATAAIALGGSDDERRRLLPELVAGRLRASIALCESEAGWLPENWTLEPAGRLHGEKHLVLYPAGADLIVVGVRGGMTLVEADASVTTTCVEGVDRTRRMSTVRFDATPHRLLAGGTELAQRVFDLALTLLAADAFGGAHRCVELAVDYAQTREQFGVTIAHFQALKHQLADLALEVEPARGLYWYAAHALDRQSPDGTRFSALANAHLTQRYLEAGRRTVEVHGGIGYTWECDVHIFLKRAIFDRAYLGAPVLQRARVAALNGW